MTNYNVTVVEEDITELTVSEVDEYNISISGDTLLLQATYTSELINDSGFVTQGFTAENTSATNILKGQPVAIYTTGVQLASAATTKYCIGIAAENINIGHSGLIAVDRELELADWTAILGTQYLTPNQTYYLSGTSGKIATEPPASMYSQIIGSGLTTTKLLINISLSIKL